MSANAPVVDKQTSTCLIPVNMVTSVDYRDITDEQWIEFGVIVLQCVHSCVVPLLLEKPCLVMSHAMPNLRPFAMGCINH